MALTGLAPATNVETEVLTPEPAPKVQASDKTPQDLGELLMVVHAVLVPEVIEAEHEAQPSQPVPSPEPKVIEPEVPAQPPNPEQPQGKDLGEFKVLCYNLPGITASGSPVGHGTVAVDPKVIPMGSRIHIPGYGEAVAKDTGGAIKGKVLDTWKPTRAECIEWGARFLRITLIE